MNLDLGSFAFGSNLENGAGTPSWGTALGQSHPEYKITYPGAEAILIGMIYCSVPLSAISLPLGKGGRIYKASELDECQIASLFSKVFINGIKVNYPFIVVLIKENSESHSGRKSIKYSEKNAYQSEDIRYSNQEFLREARNALGLTSEACWFVYNIEVYNQDELHMSAVIVDAEHSITYINSSERRNKWIGLIPESKENQYKGEIPNISLIQQTNTSCAPLLTALHTKPFALLAGISGTGKSRIVRELAKACWPKDSDERKAHKPSNFEMVQVRPNWHDSSDVLGYVSRISGKPEFVAGDFLKFIVRAWENLEKPYFLCLDEMNLAPVEQYFAEYLSVIETRKQENGIVVTDPIMKKEAEEWYHTLVCSLTADDSLKQQFLTQGISIPQNLFVVGTVNMDETTFSFSRKVLDRAMTIEMNDVDLKDGLEADAGNEFGEIGNSIIPHAVEGKDVYADNKELCDNVIAYLESVNEVLDKTPFKIAYRTRNEFLVYAVTRGEESLIAALDEMTSMKILSRIEGDSDRTANPLEALKKIVDEMIVAKLPQDGRSISAEKIAEMLGKLQSGYTSFWS